MNIKPLLTGAAIITIIYIIVFFVFIKGCDKKEKLEEEPAVVETTPQEEPQGEATQPIATTDSKDPLYGVEPYSNEYFTYIPQNIPVDIQRAITASGVKAGIAVNLESREVHWALNPNTAYPMASVTKMMTALVAVRKMLRSNGAITLETPIKVTRAASLIGGRQVWLDPKETFTFDEILKCVLVHSANDCAYLLGEFMGNGDIQSFIQDMNKQAQELGCTHFHFINSHGLTDKVNKDENSGSPAELAYLASVLLNIPQIMKWTGVRTEYLRENDEAFKSRNKGQATMLSTSNSLLKEKVPGVNGMKTGYTDNAGFCIVITCVRNEKRTCVVLMGCKNAKSRDALGKALLNWLYAN
ncbi:MAG: D-alanyl-D-alanine carboxypeptidase [Victivallales bacterium]|nr:D-alanyl-D-alanine carboxypeptidase [Victivallales bacterium]